MKKTYIIILAVVVLLSGCSNKKVITCYKTKKIDNGSYENIYIITYNNDVPSSLIVKNNIKTTNKEYLNSYYDSFSTSFKLYKKLNGVKYNINKMGNKLNTTLKINYKKVDNDKLSKISTLYDKDKLTQINFNKTIKSLGFTCK